MGDEINSKILSRINQLERQILVHSYIYYEKDSNIWDDLFYDNHCIELYNLINENPREARLAEWAIYFENYDPSTGFGLPLNHPWVIGKGEYIYNLRFGAKKVVSKSVQPSKESKNNLFNINTQDKKNKTVEKKTKQGKLF